ncbi:hypothetical protein IE53DRAFT_225625 [Violaceomyces palustris]|uniref:Uncharacterized protein n=1 Tax=Violaceomyces palustris TaxID=1673888 RepID=A0ACD0NQ58_9BASI|nr:hypothetical protein IE53DRAFT_225625 [Violaceomyces palustris]
MTTHDKGQGAFSFFVSCLFLSLFFSFLSPLIPIPIYSCLYLWFFFGGAGARHFSFMSRDASDFANPSPSHFPWPLGAAAPSTFVHSPLLGCCFQHDRHLRRKTASRSLPHTLLLLVAFRS